MKHIPTFITSHFNSPRTIIRLIYSTLMFLTIISSSTLTNAQSKDQTNPTRLTTNEISGLIDSDSIGNSYYYSFTANRGEISITLTVEPGKPENYGDLGLATVSFRLFKGKAEEFANNVADNGVATAATSGTKSFTARTKATTRQMMLLCVDIPSGFSNKSIGGKYRIRIDGAVEFPQPSYGGTGNPQLDEALRLQQTRTTSDYTKCLPKSGTLIIKMKDGSKKIIDLNEAEEITVVP